MKATTLFLAALCFLLPSTGSARADTAGISFNSPGDTLNNGLGFSLGYSFLVNTPLSVTSLGYFDDDGLQETHTVGLYDAEGALLASTTVSGTGKQVGYFNYSTIAPLSLQAGQVYEVVGTSGLLDLYAYRTAGLSSDASITYLHDSFALGDTLQFGTKSENLTSSAGGAFFGANFLATSAAAVTPEPASVLLLATGLMGAAGLERKRRRPAEGPSAI